MNSIIYSYAKMINDGICTIDQIPAQYRDDVSTYIQSGGSSSPSGEEIPVIGGAFCLPTMTVKIDTSILGNNGSIDIGYLNTDIFTKDVVGANPMPESIEYSCIRVENVYGKFQSNPQVEIINESGLTVRISGTPKNIVPDCTILRIDIKITSSNYEDMRFTLYIKAE